MTSRDTAAMQQATVVEMATILPYTSFIVVSAHVQMSVPAANAVVDSIRAHSSASVNIREILYTFFDSTIVCKGLSTLDFFWLPFVISECLLVRFQSDLSSRTEKSLV